MRRLKSIKTNSIYWIPLLLAVLLVSACKNGGTGVEISPVITSVEPDSGRYGTTVVISGERFGTDPADNRITFNGVEAVVSNAEETLLVTEVPKGAGTGSVEVTVDGQTGTGPEFNYILTVTVSTWAGTCGEAGYADGTGTDARFNAPVGLAVNNGGELFVADHLNHRIRKIDADRTVTTVAGSGNSGFKDGIGTEAEFYNPGMILLASSGEMYISDWRNHAIRHMSTSGSVTTFAGSGTFGDTDGTGSNAEFSGPLGLAFDRNGHIIVADYANHKIRSITPAREVTTSAGSGTAGLTDGAANAAEFNRPTDVAVAPDGEIYIAESENHAIRKLSGGEVGTVAGSGQEGFRDGAAGQAQFYHPFGLEIAPDGSIYVADESNHRIRRITSGGRVITIAGAGMAGYLDGPGETAQFNDPIDVVLDGEGNLFVAEAVNHCIRKLTLE